MAHHYDEGPPETPIARSKWPTTVEHARLEKAEKELARKCDVLEAKFDDCNKDRVRLQEALGDWEHWDTLEQDNIVLRKLLWLSRNDGSAYGDDGEMQLRGLDYRRMPVSELDAAIQHEG